MIFENAINSSRQGDIGEARAIYEYTKMGYVVSRTLFDSAKYDLIIDNGSESIKRVQVKTSNSLTKYGVWQVTLCTSGGNKSGNIKILRQDSDYDVLFVLTGDNRCWSIPTGEFKGGHAINMGKKYDQFEIK